MSFDVKNSEFRATKNSGEDKENVYFSKQDISAQVNTQSVVTGDGKLITYSSLLREDATARDTKILNAYFQDASGHILDFGESILEKQTKSKNDFRSGKYKGNLQDKLRRDKESVMKLHAQKKEFVKNFLVQRKKIANSQIPKKIKVSWTKSFNGEHIEGVYLSGGDISDLKTQGIKVLPNYQYAATLMDAVGAVQAVNIDALGEDCTLTQKKCLDGSGVRVAVIDTGVDYTRNELGGCFGQGCKVVDGYDYVSGDNDPMDENGHGTHVAGIISADGALKGVAPKTQIYAYRVLNANGTGWVSSIISAIERAVDPNFDENFDDKIHIVNLSLGGPVFLDDPLPQVVDTVSQAGVVVVVAGGNSGPGGNNQCYGEGEQRLGSICSPGNALEAITVGATYKKDYEGTYWLDKNPRKDAVTSFSSRGPAFFQKDGDTLYFSMKPDVAAPGAIICSTRYDSIFPTGENIYYYPCNNDEEHVQIAGTSMAAPMAAGVVALLLEGHPNWTPQQIKFALRNSADNLGQSYYLQGKGGVNLTNSLIITQPLIAQISSTSLQDKKLTLSGTLDGANLDHFKIYYSLGIEGKDYVQFDTKPITVPILDGILYQGNFDSLIVGNGYVSFKILLFDKDGNQASDESFVKLKNYEILNPLQEDVYRLGSKISLEANLPDEYEYRIEYGLGVEPLAWSSQGINLFRNGTEIGEWDTKILSEGGFYGMRIIMNYQGKEFIHRIKLLYFDPTLKEGWPQRVKLDTLSRGEYRYFSWGGYLEPVVADIDNDRKKEIVVFRSGIKNVLRVYRDNGMVYWEKELDSSLLYGDVLLTGYEPIPVVTDLNNDGYQEILVLDAHSYRDEFGTPQPRLVVFDHTGDLYDKMALNPLDLPTMFTASMMVSDLNADEKKEIIIRNHIPNFFMILDWKGNEISRRGMPPTNWGGDLMSHPAVGNFDDDSDLEIVLAGPGEGAGGWNPETGDIKRSGFVSVYNMDGSEVNAGWPKIFNDPIFSSPVVGDINHDGMDDIVVGLFRNDVTREGGGVYAMDRYGNVLEGWPALTGWNYWASPSLSDYNDDGYLEVGVSRIGFVTSLIDWRGKVLWEGVMPWNSYYAVVAADIDNDSIPNILTASDNGFQNFGWGGVHAWNIMGGQEVWNKFPKVTETAVQAPITISDIDNDGFIEIVASSFWNPFAGRGSGFRDTLYVWDIDSEDHFDSMPWPEFQHDVERTGRYTPLPDRTPPVVQLIFPKPQESIRGMVTITAEARDYHSSVEKVDFYLDNFSLLIGEGKKDAAQATFSVVWDTTSVANGSHTLRAKAYDASGNNALSQSVEVITQNLFFLRGDANSDGEIDISDSIRIILYLFSDGLEIGNKTRCYDALDANDDGQLDISDSIYLLNYLFKGGLRPPEPISQIGIDPTEDSLECLIF